MSTKEQDKVSEIDYKNKHVHTTLGNCYKDTKFKRINEN